MLLTACGGNAPSGDPQTAGATPTAIVTAPVSASSAAATGTAPSSPDVIQTPAGNSDPVCGVIDTQFFANITGATQVVPRKERGAGVICRFEYFNEATKKGWIAQIERMADPAIFCEGSTSEYFAAGTHRARVWTLTTADGKSTFINGTVCTKTLLLNVSFTNAPDWNGDDMRTYLKNIAAKL
jgi:hypothetical protein